MKEHFSKKISDEKTSNGTCLEVPCDAKGPTLKVPNETSSSEEVTGANETPEKSIQACSSANNDSLGVENKGFDVSETESSPCHVGKVTDKNGYELPSSTVSPNSLEMNCGTLSDSKVSSKPSNDSSDPESALPVTPVSKTVRAWLKNPHLYKVHGLIP